MVTRRSIVCDTTVLLYLGRIDQLRLLPELYSIVYVTEAVTLELDMGRLLRPDTINPRNLEWVNSVSIPEPNINVLPPNRLGRGERSVIAFAQSCDDCLAGLDDLQARRLAERLGLGVTGTLGILVQAKRAGLIPALRALIDELIVQGFLLGSELYQEVLVLVGEDS